MKHFQEYGPLNDYETLVYFVNQIDKTPFIIQGVLSKNIVIVKYKNILLDIFISHKASKVLHYDYSNVHLIVCWENNCQHLPVLDISQENWTDINFDNLIKESQYGIYTSK